MPLILQYTLLKEMNNNHEKYRVVISCLSIHSNLAPKKCFIMVFLDIHIPDEIVPTGNFGLHTLLSIHWSR